jgi:hypothetical protein
VTDKRLNTGAWLLSAAVSALAIYVWGESLRWNFQNLSLYTIFPVLGLLAFSIMWSHYIASVVRQHFKIDRSVTSTYFEVTSYIVLALILLHPGLLIWQLYHDNLGLPPASFERVYGWATLLGMGALFVFLAYEFRRKFEGRLWWRYVQYLSDIAMLVIFYHGLKLGTQLHVKWFRPVWYFYGLSLTGSLMYIYWYKIKTRRLL